jgi:hypothetical protein
MSIEIVNIFTSSNNINYLKDEISKKISNNDIKEAILDNIIEDIFNFYSHALLEDSGQNLRHSINVKNELDRINNLFIADRLAFAENYRNYVSEQQFYADQMFIDDSLKPYPYNNLNNNISSSLNEDYYEEENMEKRIFRYQDNNNKNRSSIPRWQINKRGNTDYNNNDELRESELSHVRRTIEKLEVDYITDAPVECYFPKWIDI